VTLVIAHRGASFAFPENTLAAFEGARSLGADWVELDVRRSADAALVVLHDAALPSGALAMNLARSEIDSDVPSLDAALDACAGMGVNIEIKNHPIDPDHDPSMVVAKGVVAEVQRRAAHDPAVYDRVLVSCFDLDTVDAVKALDPAMPTAYLVLDPEGTTAVALAADRGHRAIHPWNPMVDEALISDAHDAGLLVNTWTVDDPDRIVELAAWGIDGIVTNVPDVARAALKRA
jgi:glycerophosphoryl diester phosphodiesterase